MKLENSPATGANERTLQRTLNRRDLLKLSAAALLGSGAGTALVIEPHKNSVDDSCETPPVPTGSPLFDVYGNKVDSNELLRDGYASAVKQEECRNADD